MNRHFNDSVAALLLFVSQKRGYGIVEVPIHWYYSAESRMRLVRDSLRALMELFIIRRNWRAGLYDRPNQLTN